MKSIGIIPARGGSKGIPNKNIYPVNGKPLIEYTIDAAKRSNLDEIVVSTDSIEIANIVKKRGVKVIFRPPELAQDCTPTLPVLQHTLKELDDCFDFVVTLQPTSPFRRSEHINQAISLITNDNMADSLVSVIQVPHNMVPESIMCLNNGYLIDYQQHSNTQILRRQDKGTYFARNGAAIYITKVKNIRQFIFGGKIIPYKMDFFSSLDIDSLDDILLAETLLKTIAMDYL